MKNAVAGCRILLSVRGSLTNEHAANLVDGQSAKKCRHIPDTVRAAALKDLLSQDIATFSYMISMIPVLQALPVAHKWLLRLQGLPEITNSNS